MNADGQVRLERAAALLGSPSQEDARAALGELVYDEPGTGRLVPAAEYLSGKVRAKLQDAEKAAEADPRFAVNVAALRGVLPADLGPGEIDARLGASWVPPGLVQQGLREILEDPSLTAVKGHGTTWQVKGNTHSIAARAIYGTADKDALALAQCVLEQRPVKVSYSMDDLTAAEKRQLSSARSTDDMNAFMRARAAAATIAARAKADELSDRFGEWLWEDPQRSAGLARVYNEKFNSLRCPGRASRAQGRHRARAEATAGLRTGVTVRGPRPGRREHQLTERERPHRADPGPCRARASGDGRARTTARD